MTTCDPNGGRSSHLVPMRTLEEKNPIDVCVLQMFLC